MEKLCRSTNQSHHNQTCVAIRYVPNLHITVSLRILQRRSFWCIDCERHTSQSITFKDRTPSTHEFFCYEWNLELCTQPNRPSLSSLPRHQQHKAINLFIYLNCEDLAVKKVVLRVKVRTIVLSFGPVSFMSLLPVEPMFRRMREESICRAVLMFEEK